MRIGSLKICKSEQMLNEVQMYELHKQKESTGCVYCVAYNKIILILIWHESVRERKEEN